MASEPIRNQVMGHSDSNIYHRYYQNQVVDADTVSAFLEEPSNKAVLRLAGHVSLTKDPNAPTRLTPAQRQEILRDPEVAAAKLKRDRSRFKLRQNHQTIEAARRLGQTNAAVGAAVIEHDALVKVFHRLQSHKEREMSARQRRDYFSMLGVGCIENQHSGRMDPAGPSPPTFAFTERSALAGLLFPQADVVAQCYDQLLKRRCETIRQIASLCTRREAPPVRRLLNQESSKLELPEEKAPCIPDNTPELYPVLCVGTQCLFCLGNAGLPTHCRVRSFASSFTLTRHVQDQHLDSLSPGPFTCPHPHCSIKGVPLEHGEHFKAHAASVHNIIHCR